MRKRACSVLLTWTCLSCASSVETPVPEAAGPEVAAVVSGETVWVDAVRQISEAQRIGAAQALELAVDDALFASAARSGPNGAARARVAERAAHARILLESLLVEAREQGPPSVAEIDALTHARWWELDRPELRRTVHAVAIVRNAAEREAAQALIARVAKATEGISTGREFMDAARALAKDAPVTLRVEVLEPVAVDGRAVDPASPPAPGTPPSRYSEKFARAAHAISAVGEQSPIVETEFGYHVLLLLERIEARRIPPDSRRELLTPELMARRASGLERELMKRLQRTIPVEIDRASLELTKKVVGPQ